VLKASLSNAETKTERQAPGASRFSSEEGDQIRLSKTVKTVDPCTSLGSTAGTPAHIARLLVILAPAHLFLDAGMLDQLAKPFDGIAD